MSYPDLIIDFWARFNHQIAKFGIKGGSWHEHRNNRAKEQLSGDVAARYSLDGRC